MGEESKVSAFFSQTNHFSRSVEPLPANQGKMTHKIQGKRHSNDKHLFESRVVLGYQPFMKDTTYHDIFNSRGNATLKRRPALKVPPVQGLTSQRPNMDRFQTNYYASYPRKKMIGYEDFLLKQPKLWKGTMKTAGKHTLRFGSHDENYYHNNAAQPQPPTNFHDDFHPLVVQRRFAKWVNETDVPVTKGREDSLKERPEARYAAPPRRGKVVGGVMMEEAAEKRGMGRSEQQRRFVWPQRDYSNSYVIGHRPECKRRPAWRHNDN